MRHVYLNPPPARRCQLALSVGLLLLATTARAQLSGTYYVGSSTSPDASRTYATLPAAVTALSSNGVAANTTATFVLLDVTYALGSTSLTLPAPAGSVVFQPAAGVSPVITSSAAGGALILDGTDNLTLDGNDGSGNRTLTIRNTAAGPAVLLQNEATANTLRYLKLESNNTSSGTVAFSTVGSGTVGNSSNLVSNCEVRDLSTTTGVPASAIYSLGTAGAVNRGNTVQGCQVHDFTAVGIALEANNGSWTIDGNSVYQTASRGALRCIRALSGDGQVITNNQVYQAAGALTSTYFGIVINSTAISGHTVSGNVVGGSAANAGGSAMAVSGTGATFYGLYLVVGTATPTIVQNNTVANVASTVANTTFGMQLNAGAFTVSGNTIGSTSSTTSITATSTLQGIAVSGTSPAATVAGNTVAGLAGTTGAVAGIYFSGTGSSGTSAVNGNTVSGLSATAGAVVGIQLTGSATVPVGTTTANTVSNLSNNAPTTGTSVAGISASGSTGVVAIGNNSISNLSQSGLSSGLYGIQANLVAGSNVTSNTVSGVSYAGSSTAQTVAGIVAGGSNQVVTNQVSNVAVTSTSINNVLGIGVGGAAGATPTVTGNTVSGVRSAATGGAFTVYGLYVGAAGVVLGAATISINLVSDVGTSSTAANTGQALVCGLLCGAATGATTRRNRIWNVYGSTTATGTNADRVRGLLVQGSYSGTFVNNQISLPGGSTTQFTTGLRDDSGSGSNNYYYNSVYLAPAGGPSTSDSFGFYRSANPGTATATNPPPVSLLNNVLFNGRTASGATAGAIGTASTSNWPATTSNYNLFISPSTGTVGAFGGTNYSFAGWKSATGGDVSSLSETSANVPAANLFVDASAGNLNINRANPEAWYVNGNGTQVSGQTSDYNGAARSTSVATGGTDIGSNEFTPTSTPPALAASAAPAPGGTQTFTLGGRMLAQLTYGPDGTVPTTVTARYYSGINPPAPFNAGARYANVYFDFSDGGTGSGYSYQPTLYYDLALLGTITNENAQQITLRNADNSGYRAFPTIVNTTARSLALDNGTSFNRLGTLAISDQAAPLPVTLAAFIAFRTGPAAELDWTSASELNSRGYEVQVSADGLTYRALGFVASTQPNSATAQHYQFVDREAGKQGTRYYRLRQVDLDATSHYSLVRPVAFGGVAATPALTAAPNPLLGGELTLTLTVARAGSATLTVLDAAGRPVLTETRELADGLNALALPGLTGLPAGLYLVQVVTKEGTLRTRVVRQ